jgi:hypothetical protein
MKGSTRFKILFSVFLVILVAGFSFGYIRFFGPEVEEDVQEGVLGVGSDTGIPYIISLPPIVAVEGGLYEYYVGVVDTDTDVENLTLEYVSGPEWLELEDMVLKGVVPIGSSGTYKIVLRVSDGYNSSTQEEYILVEGLQEYEVE